MTERTETPTPPAGFSYDDEAQTWCLEGTDENGNGWETDDYPAPTRTQAIHDANEYLATLAEQDQDDDTSGAREYEMSQERN